VVRYNEKLKATDEKLLELMDATNGFRSTTRICGRRCFATRSHLDNMLELARVITLGALNRNESRGAHYKPDFRIAMMRIF